VSEIAPNFERFCRFTF